MITSLEVLRNDNVPSSILENDTLPPHICEKNDTPPPHFLNGKVHIKDKNLS